MSYLRGILALVFLAVVVGAEEDFRVGRSEVKIAAQSGMMEFRRHRRGVANETALGRPVQIRMAQVVQLDKNGNEVTNCTGDEQPESGRRRRSAETGMLSKHRSGSGSGGMGGNQGSGSGGMAGRVSSKAGDQGSKGGFANGKRPHRSWMGRNGTGLGKRFSNFDNTKFTVETKKDKVKLKNSRALKAFTKRFHANLGDGVGKMAIDMALPENDGDIEIDGEKQKLKKGDLKFNIELSDWSWCGEEGDDGAAAFLDVYVEVNSTRPPGLRRRRTASTPASFDLGDNTTISFSGKFERDGRWLNVVEDYPKVDSEDPSLIVVRFTRFNISLLYDPTVSVEEEASDDSNSNGAGRQSVSAIFVAMATALTYAFLK